MSTHTMTDAAHTQRCKDNAEVSVRENCQAQLTAAAWDHAAMVAENEWVRQWAIEWLADGTSECICNPQPMSTTTLTLADDYANGVAADLINYTQEDLLEVSYDEAAAMWSALLTYGGPTAICTGDPFSRTGVLVHVSWGTDRAIRYVYCPWLAEMLAEMPAPETH